MNDAQQDRLNKVLKTIGYIISSVIVWFYTTKGLAFLLAPTGVEGKDTELFIVVGIGWPILALILTINFYSLYGWIKTGKKGDLFEALFGETDNE